MKRYLFLLAALAACTRGDAADAPIETESVRRRDIIVDAQATGVVEPINIVEVKSKSSGQIVQMPVEVGTEVRPGDLLVQLDTRDVKNQYDQAAADLAAAQARQDVAEAQRRRAQELYDRQITTRQEFETSALEFENARASLVRARTNLDLAEQRLEEATVRAPVTGTIIEKPVSLGQVITSATGSASGGTTILKMADLNQVRVRALVNESDIGQIQPGMPARVTVDAYPDRPFIGTVEKIEPQAVVQQSVTMFPVLVALSNEGGMLKPGMNGEVSVIVNRRENVLAVPNDAIRTMREAGMVAAALGLDPDAVQAQLRSQMTGGRGGPQGGQPGGDTGTGASVRVGAGDVSVEAQPAQGAARPEGQRPEGQRGEGRRPRQGSEAQGSEAQGSEAQGARPQGMRPEGMRPEGGRPEGGAPEGMRGAGFGGGFGGVNGGAARGGRGRMGLLFVAKDGSYEPRMVRLGASDFDYTEVLGGVEEGEEVALLAVAALQQQRAEQNERMRSRMSLPGMSRPSGGQGGAARGGAGAPGGGGR